MSRNKSHMVYLDSENRTSGSRVDPIFTINKINKRVQYANLVYFRCETLASNNNAVIINVLECEPTIRSAYTQSVGSISGSFVIPVLNGQAMQFKENTDFNQYIPVNMNEGLTQLNLQLMYADNSDLSGIARWQAIIEFEH